MIVLNYDGTTMTITDDLLKQLVQAIATAPKIDDGHTLTATPGYTLVFYNSRVHLGSVPTGAEIIFYINDTPYRDEKGALRAVWQRFLEKQHSPQP